jgi:histidinol-phosphatase (PHP family)
VVVEVNTGGIARGRTVDCYPSVNLLRRLKSANVPVMINGDAHNCELLDAKFDIARRQLLDAGYKSIVYFTGRKNGKAAWEETRIDE